MYKKKDVVKINFLELRKRIIEKEYTKLNNKQKEAVFNTDGPLLVLAGAGSGKTTVIIHKIAQLIMYGNAYFDEYIPPQITDTELDIMNWYLNDEIDELPYEISQFIPVKPVKPYNILAITFTNKAANELKSRLYNFLGEAANDIWASTFHSMCVRILRRDIDKLGYDKSFVIFDTSDQQTVIKECIKELSLNDKEFTPRYLASAISGAKSALVEPSEYTQAFGNGGYFEVVAKVYKLYQRKLKSYNALDFDDLLNLTVELFEENEDVLDYYQNRFKYILVDEYQDTNAVQYKLVSLLAAKNRNLCVVGDDDQSIYKFRGADISNILNFEKEFKDAKVIKLEENYRSTQNILSAANAVIKNNAGRKGKNLWTSNGDGNKIVFYEGDDNRAEADFISKKIKDLCENDNYSDFAILYRANAQSRSLEESLLHSAIPYRVFGGIRFYDRKEIKDLTSYLRLVQNNDDNVALKRIINEPARKIGAKTVSTIEELALEKGVSMFEVCRNISDYDVTSSIKNHVGGFAEIILKMIENKNSEDVNLYELVNSVIQLSGLKTALMAEKSVENTTRLENIDEFLNMVQAKMKDEPNITLEQVLEDISLISDVDNYDDAQNSVALMTIHSAKGLEFPTVFIAGMEEGTFPGLRSIGNEAEMEEERRLCYVGITRAKKNLFLTQAKARFMYGSTKYTMKSRFVDEIPSELIEIYRPPVKKIDRSKIPSTAASKFSKLASVGTNSSVSSAKNSETNEFVKQFSSGDRVQHRVFGDGTVESAQKMGEDVMLIINFDNGETKRLLAAYSKNCLTKI